VVCVVWVRFLGRGGKWTKGSEGTSKLFEALGKWLKVEYMSVDMRTRFAFVVAILDKRT
jgi:hypothetical protein